MSNLIEPLEFIKKIHNEGVKYLLIGRQAVIAYGGPMQSMDYDIYIDGLEENTRKLLDIAKDFALYPSIRCSALPQKTCRTSNTWKRSSKNNQSDYPGH